MNIGENIRTIRENKNMTQTQLAEKVGTTQSQIGKYERNEQDMTVYRLIEIANWLGVGIVDIVK